MRVLAKLMPVALVALLVVLGVGVAAAQADPLTVAVADTSGAEGTGANTTMTFNVTLSAPAPAGGVTVDYNTAPGTGPNPAAAGTDFVNTYGTLQNENAPLPDQSPPLQFAEGETAKDVVVTIIGDSTDEFDETFKLVLGNAQAVAPATIGIARAVGIGTIADDDQAPSVNVADTVASQPVADGVNRVVIFTVSLSAPSGKVVTVDYATQDGTGPAGAKACTNQTCNAPADGDYVPLRGTMTFQPGVTGLQVSVIAIGDSLDVTRSFSLVLTNPSHLRSVNAVTFTGGDVGKAITVAGQTRTIAQLNPSDHKDVLLDAPVANGAGLSFSFLRNYADGIVAADSLQSNTAVFTVADVGKAITIGSGGGAVTTTITAFTNAHQVSLTPGAVPDGVAQPFSYVADYDDANVTGGTNQSLGGHATATGTITSVGPAASITGTSLDEGAAGTTSVAHVTVRLDHPAPQALSLAVASADGTAKAPADYQALPAGRRVTFAAGEDTRTVDVTIVGNATSEADKTFTVVLSDPQGATLQQTNATAVVTIRNDDAPPSLSAPDVTVKEPHGTTGSADVTVTLSAPSAITISATYATQDGTANAGTNYQTTNGTLTFSPGDTVKHISVPVAGDGQVTEDQSFTVSIQNSAPGAGALSARVTLADSDSITAAKPTVTINDAVVHTSGGTGGTAVFTLRLDQPFGRHVTVDYTTADGTATAPRDYTAVAGTATFAAGQVTQTVSVPVRASQALFNAAFRLRLSHPLMASIGRAEGAGIIINDGGASGPALSVPGRLKAADLVCASARRCPGVLVRWGTTTAATVRISVTAVVPAAGGHTGRGVPRASRPRARVVVLASRSVRVKSGPGAARVGAVMRARARGRLLRDLRAGHVKQAVITATFIHPLGAQEQSRVSVGLTT